MSPINKKSISEKLELLNEAIRKLDEIKLLKRDEFASDFFIHDTAIRNLVLGIEIIVDIGNHILSETFQSSAKFYKDVIIDLGEGKVIPKDFAKENAEMADFRNLIIHAYGKLDIKQVYQNLQKSPDIFRKFAKYYIKFLEKH
ncbi:DUF86 domain-containing protein [Patescibacteria group bacterium]|nr:DUF86 domain-containing protein [Patescibacteria group bacterium]MBU4000310.1 DUF86 domain-containing protein [Patescibacteria group bacterium]MBU4056923.1 DUF86 domain-containing protein [Patescibacteria group bacterium]MBU4368449.1 DUF86 domain-containing protein [Patescibacteria group bacterium]